MEKAGQKLELITKYFTEFTTTQLHQLAMLDEVYTFWNEKINVLSRKDISSLYEKHVLHSLSIAAIFDLNGKEVLDLGTGGGFPGIPLAIFFPEAKFHLADSIGKKIKVVEAVAETLGLANVTAEHTRVEAIKNRQFDTVVSRAVAPLKELWNWSRPLLRKNKPTDKDAVNSNGLICLKGGDLSAEIYESGCRPNAIEISTIFTEAFFAEKYLLFVSR